MSADIQTRVSERTQQYEFQNSTLQGTGDGRFAFSVATFIEGLPSVDQQEHLAAVIREVLDRMSEAAKPANVSFEVQIGAALTVGH